MLQFSVSATLKLSYTNKYNYKVRTRDMNQVDHFVQPFYTVASSDNTEECSWDKGLHSLSLCIVYKVDRSCEAKISEVVSSSYSKKLFSSQNLAEILSERESIAQVMQV